MYWLWAALWHCWQSGSRATWLRTPPDQAAPPRAGRRGEQAPKAEAQRRRQRPARVRAMLGALGEEIGIPERRLRKLRGSLGPVSKYDLGRLATLRHAKEWQAK